MERKECARCGEATPTIDNVQDLTSYYGFQVKTETETVVRRSIRLIAWAIFGPFSRAAERGGSTVLQSDEERPLCDQCGGLLVGRFMQGRSVPAIKGKETW